MTTVIVLGHTDSLLCPFSALLHYIVARGDSLSPFFLDSSKGVIIKPWSVTQIRDILRNIGLLRMLQCLSQLCFSSHHPPRKDSLLWNSLQFHSHTNLSIVTGIDNVMVQAGQIRTLCISPNRGWGLIWCPPKQQGEVQERSHDQDIH